MVCPQVRKLPGTREVAAAGVNSDLWTVTKGNAEILQKPNPVTSEGVGVKKLHQVQLEEGKFCPDIRTNTLFMPFSREEKPCTVLEYLHTSPVTVPLRAADHPARNILICGSKDAAVRQICPQ